MPPPRRHPGGVNEDGFTPYQAATIKRMEDQGWDVDHIQARLNRMGRHGGSRCRTASKRAGLTFPVPKVAKRLKTANLAKRIGTGAPIYLAAVLEYLTAELLELAGNCAKDVRMKRITPRHIALAIQADEELVRFLGNVTIAEGGVPENIPAFLQQKNKKKQRRPAKAKKAGN